MAEGTRMKDIQEMQKKQEILLIEEKAERQASEQHFNAQLENVLAMQASMQSSMEELQRTMHQQMQSMVEQMQAYNRNKSVLGEGLTANPVMASSSRFVSSPQAEKMDSHTDTNSSGLQGSLSSFPKLEFPKFNGEEPRAWIRKCNRYFQIANTISEEQKVPVASVHLEGKAEMWLQGYMEGRDMPSWSEFIEAIFERFDDLEPEYMVGEFNKLQQTGSVNEYLEKFEELKSYMLLFYSHFPESYFLASFVSGLKEEIRANVRTLKPTSLLQAISLARKQETYVDAIMKKTQTSHKPNPQPKPPFKNFTYSPPKPPQNRYKTQPKPLEKPPRRLLTAAEMKARRDKNLCYNCDEVYTPGHRCKYIQHIMTMSEEEEQEYLQEGEEAEIVEEEEPSKEDMTVSMNAMTGSASLNTLRMGGNAYGKEIQVLIDSGSTNCFLDEETARQIGCVLEYTTPMQVSVAGGEKIISNMFCPNFTWRIQDHEFKYPIRVIRLGGCDMVLGGDWLRRHSPVEFDYDKMWVTVMRNGKKLTMKAITEQAELRLISTKSMRKLIKKGKYGLVGQVYSVIMQPQEPQECQPGIEEMLGEYKDVFQEPTELPPIREIEHQIQLVPNAEPKKQAPYRYTHAQKTEIETLVRDMLESGIIRPSQSSFSAPVLLVKKKDGTWRMCVDYRYLNKLTVKHDFPIPVIDELLDELYGACYFSKIDLRSGYFQIRMKPQDIFKTSFVTHHGHYEFLVMPFGLCNAPATFQSLMNLVFADYLRKFVLVFFDDILIYSKSVKEHIQHLRIVLEVLRKNKLYAKRGKCSFGRTSIEYLGHVISKQGVSTDPSKIECMVNWPLPANIKALRGFLGLTGYYRKFIQNYGIMSKPLTDLLKKEGFVWTSRATEAFEKLKGAMISAPVLALPDFSKTFIIETDACDKGIGAVLMQEGRPIAYLSKALGVKNQGLSIYEKEFLAVMMAVGKWKQYIQGQHFIIRTDQQSLKYILEQKVESLLQQRWISKLLGLDYEVQYKKGSENRAADALSRKEQQGSHCAKITIIIPGWIGQLQESYLGDPEFQEILQAKAINQDAYPEYSLINGILKKENLVCVGSKGDLRRKIIQALHNSALGGHSGIQGTYQRVKQTFHWVGLKKDVMEWVSHCDTCQRAKHETNPYPGLLQPLQIPQQAWSHITMDFIEGLPTSENRNCIMVVVDRLTKYAHFIPLTHPFTAEQVAKVFLDQIYKLHGLPINIVTDRDKIFTSSFWKELFRVLGTELSMSTAYHPQSDGQTERVNQCLETYLRCMTHMKPKQWNKWLPLAEFWYNTNYHSSLKMTPFQALYGYKPSPLSLGPYTQTLQSDVQQLMLERQKMIQLLKENLQQAQSRMKHYADTRRVERSFEVGDMVFLKLQPYRQSSVQMRKNLKLSPRYFGPYKVLEKIGKVAYRLELPPHSNIHPVFHVSLLKKKIGSLHTPSPVLPIFDDTNSCRTFPIKILARRIIPRRNAPVPQLLIQWDGFDEAHATWEDYYQIRQQFPDFNLDPCGQGFQKEGRNVMFLKGSISLNVSHQIRNARTKSDRTIEGKEFGNRPGGDVVPTNATLKSHSATNSNGAVLGSSVQDHSRINGSDKSHPTAGGESAKKEPGQHPCCSTSI